MKKNADITGTGSLKPDHGDLKSDNEFELPNMEKSSTSTHAEYPIAQEALDPIEALGMPHWRKVEKKLKRRLDLTLMPMLWVLYFHNYLDRNNIASGT